MCIAGKDVKQRKSPDEKSSRVGQRAKAGRNIKERPKGTVKPVDRATALTDHAKSVFIRTKETAEPSAEQSPEEYADNQVEFGAEWTARKTAGYAVRAKRFTVNRVRNAYQNQHKAHAGDEGRQPPTAPEVRQERGRELAKRQAIDRLTEQQKAPQTSRPQREIRSREIFGDKAQRTLSVRNRSLPQGKTVKHGGKGVKTASRTEKISAKAFRAGRQGATSAVRSGQLAEKSTRSAAKRVAEAAKAAARASVKAIRVILSAFRSLISALIAGGSAIIAIILVICLLGLVAASSFGIFFSGDAEPEGRNMRVVMREINMEFSGRLTAIERANPYDVLDRGGTSASWKDVLAIYTVKHSTESSQPIEVATLTPEKEEYLRTVFWDMNKITYNLEVRQGETVTEDGTEVTETRILHIRIRGLTQAEIAMQYGFSERQMAQLAELTDSQFDDAWRNLLYGSSGGSGDIVAVALSQVGNVGGQPYWSWYGFGGKVDWCACFVSWCANECGYIDTGTIPKFSGCTSQGMAWFQARGQWADRSYTPNPGDLIFFDWDSSGDADHVGIVERVENGTIYTVEGNSGSPDAVRQQSYPVGSRQIRGYGFPAY